jgi:hypothetical protein
MPVQVGTLRCGVRSENNYRDAMTLPLSGLNF